MEILNSWGFITTGVDISPEMTQRAKNRNPQSTVLTGNVLKQRFSTPFDGVVAFAFIHLFPKRQAVEMLGFLGDLLRQGGILYIGTTDSEISTEGFVAKIDYEGAPRRFRKYWTRPEFEEALRHTGFAIEQFLPHPDPFGKVWNDYVARKQ